jgi:hypothetical protein
MQLEIDCIEWALQNIIEINKLPNDGQEFLVGYHYINKIS